jgi:hypothetical protein
MGGVGQPAFPAAAAQAEIGEQVAAGRNRPAAEVRDGIAERYGARHTGGGVSTLRARLRCHPKVPRPLNPRAALAAQEAWKRGAGATPKGAAGLSAAAPMGVADEMRVRRRGMVRRVWGKRGIKVRQWLQIADEGRYRFLAVDRQAGRVFWCWPDALSAIDVAGAVRRPRPSGVAALVGDRASAHREQRARALGLPLVARPPASPELNPAERVFEELRRAVEGRMYPTLADKADAVGAELARIEADPDCVRRMTGCDWITAAIRQLPHAHAA